MTQVMLRTRMPCRQEMSLLFCLQSRILRPFLNTEKLSISLLSSPAEQHSGLNCQKSLSLCLICLSLSYLSVLPVSFCLSVLPLSVPQHRETQHQLAQQSCGTRQWSELPEISVSLSYLIVSLSYLSVLSVCLCLICLMCLSLSYLFVLYVCLCLMCLLMCLSLS